MALCRTSTGKFEWKSIFFMDCVKGNVAPRSNNSFVKVSRAVGELILFGFADSITIIGCCLFLEPVPTRAERFTSGC